MPFPPCSRYSHLHDLSYSLPVCYLKATLYLLSFQKMKSEMLKNRKNAWFFCDLTAHFCCLDGKKTSKWDLQFVLRESLGHLLDFRVQFLIDACFFSTLTRYLCWNLFGLWNLFTLTFLSELKKLNFSTVDSSSFYNVSAATSCNLLCFLSTKMERLLPDSESGFI